MTDYKDFVYILEDWAPLVNEYAKLLNRYGLATVIVLTNINNYGVGEAKLYASEDEYLELATKDNHFMLEEKQIKDLLDYIKILFEVATIDDDDFAEEDEDYIEQDISDDDEWDFY